MHINTVQSYEQFVELTAQVDNEGLHQVFFNLACFYFPDSEVRLYSNLSFTTSDRFKLIHCQQVNTDSCEKASSYQDLEVLNSLMNQESQAVIIENRVFYPILIRGLCFGGLIIQGEDIDDVEKTSILTTFLAIYCNLLSLIKTSSHDSLTGLFNRKTFYNSLEKLIGHSDGSLRRSNENDKDHTADYFIMLDIDNFKQLNDTAGHLAGDETLLSLAKLMQKTFRNEDLLFRYGGEEFSIILKNVPDDLVFSILERFRKSVVEHDFTHTDQVTISIGYTKIQKHLTINKIIDRADKALYFSKHNGKNQTHSFELLNANAQL